MVRSMYSGVVGMKAMQTAMDTIGNNIANVKTYGFKASRTTFKDVYYQTLSSGGSSSNSRGGTNPTQIGYGAQQGSIDVLQEQSSFSMTGRSLDMAIAGEGFFQVQDTDGNTFYTRAGQLLFDASGNLVDSNGNFVLGVSGDPLGKSGSSERIQLSIPPVSPTVSSITSTINNVKYTFSATNPIDAGNVSFNIQTDETMPGGMPAKAEFTGGGTGITIYLNPTETFADQAALEKAINDAITETNGGVAHPAGRFNLTIEPATKLTNLTGEQIVSKDYTVTPGKIATGTWPKELFGGMEFVTTSSNFSGSGAITAKPTATKVGTSPLAWEISVTIDGKEYKGRVEENRTAAGEFLLKNGDESITMTHPGYTKLEEVAATDATVWPADITVTASEPSKNLGLGSTAIQLKGGTEGGPQGLENLQGISIAADGVITAQHSVHGNITVGRIDLAVFANPQGLLQAGNTYFSAGPNSGNVHLSRPGFDGSGELAGGSLEQSNVDLSQEFSDMITTQRAYQANSRLITVSDTMLEELVNLKR